ncbi:hypothetical protein JRO89_XS14G0074500 [Xanthoceras sorbifolium]|uniref:Uncharacterized protein n=1 Tax=Xanthoceras sorbifolium TaxID=99658 RepID=A0ABQ8H4C5_9ROSI|nr:hypothetical protein JRO89_XS14G0074500 [Xanthoceras sorbifolium]
MAFTAILRRSASSLATLASRLTGVNINYHSVIFRTTSSHLYRKPALKYFVPAFDFSSTTEIKNLTLDELLPQIVDLKCKFADHDNVSDILSDFPFKIEDNLDGYYNILLTREYNNEFVKVFGHTSIMFIDLHVTISKYGGHGPSLNIRCDGYVDKIIISSMVIIDSENLKDSTKSEDVNNAILGWWYDENLKKTIHKYLEIRGIKPSMVEFLLGPYPTNKAKKKMLMNLKKIKNSLEQLS